VFVKWPEYVSGVEERCTRNFDGVNPQVNLDDLGVHGCKMFNVYARDRLEGN